MISLRDRIEIHATARQIFAWLETMPQEYVSWHPDHVACRVLHGRMLEVGAEIECEEYLHGELHRMRFRMTRVVPDERVEFRIRGMGRGAFAVQSEGDAVEFTAELDIGTESPFIGPVFDFIFSVFFRRRLEAMRKHIAEEGENLKAIIESGSLSHLDRNVV
jgi:hypothetical protein